MDSIERALLNLYAKGKNIRKIFLPHMFTHVIGPRSLKKELYEWRKYVPLDDLSTQSDIDVLISNSVEVFERLSKENK